MTYSKVRDFTQIYTQFSIISRRRMAAYMSKPSGTKLVVYVKYFLEKILRIFQGLIERLMGKYSEICRKKQFFLPET